MAVFWSLPVAFREFRVAFRVAVLEERGQQLQDRQGRIWTVRAAPYLEAGEYRVVLNAGDQVLIERERYADSYILVEDAA